MRSWFFAIALVAVHSLSSIQFISQRSDQSSAPKQTRRKTEVDLRYDKKKDVSTVRLRDIVLWQGVQDTEQVRMTLAFEYPKRIIVTPQSVSLKLSSFTKGMSPFNSENLAAVIDGVRLDLGKMKDALSQDFSPSPGGYIFDKLETSIPYQDFSRIAQAKKASIMIGDRKYVLLDQHLQSLRDFLELMQQDGQEFK